MLTVRDDVLGVNAGIDESNVAEGFVLLPENSYQSAAHIWQFLRKQYGLREVGVIITDSVSMPLRWGVVGRSLGHCGFKAIKEQLIAGSISLIKDKDTLIPLNRLDTLRIASLAIGENKLTVFQKTLSLGWYY